jgi:hypothetical protein
MGSPFADNPDFDDLQRGAEASEGLAQFLRDCAAPDDDE